MEAWQFGYSDIMQMGVRKIAVYVTKAIAKAEQAQVQSQA